MAIEHQKYYNLEVAEFPMELAVDREIAKQFATQWLSTSFTGRINRKAKRILMAVWGTNNMPRTLA